MPDPKYMVIAGATGVGKTDLAFEVAQNLQTEIVGADAFQIYKGLDILTGKPALSQLRSLNHHLISLIPLTETFDANRYASLARQTICTLNQGGIIPLVVGGTGFYLHSLEQSLPSLPSADKSLRSELERRPTPVLLKELADRDAVAFNRIDRQNRRRVIRALEVCIISGSTFSGFAKDSTPVPTIPRLFLERPRTTLIERINERVNQMFAHGVIQEVAAVEAIGPTASQAIGFSLIRSLLAGRIDENSCRESICQQTRQYAKRQSTWFRRHLYECVSAESAVEHLITTFRRAFPEDLVRRI
jgi:tRNA dimethylallyltransferase